MLSQAIVLFLLLVGRSRKRIIRGVSFARWLKRPLQNERGAFSMCYNCGCGLPDNDGGSAENITNKTFAEAAKAAGQSVEEAQKNTLELLNKITAPK
jgi:hypothetical protein